MSLLKETIAALSTPAGVGAIAIIRVSGEDAFKVCDKVFRSKKYKRLKDCKTHTVHFGRIVFPDNEKVVDEVLVTVFKGPNSFTGEDTVEISSHGGIKTPQMILEALFMAGARQAERGEFTKRAFLNGKLDLSQAEAVIDLINAKTSLSADYAIDHLDGRLSLQISQMREELIKIISHVMAVIDYPEEDIEDITIYETKNSLKTIADKINKLLKTADFGIVVQNGIKTTIAGKPNVGKSSLLNALLGTDRSIVTDVAGTTRDVVEALADINGIPLLISDTAGIHETEDVVEQIGTERSKKAIEEAQLVLFVLDLSKPVDDEDMQIFELVKDKKVILILNKNDLERKLDVSKLPDNIEKIEMSAYNDDDFDRLSKLIFDVVKDNSFDEGDEVITNLRHKTSLYNSLSSINNAISAIENGMPFDMISIDITNAIEELGSIVGKTVSEEIVDRIFSRFCLGK